jgi:hypothetical protein
MASKFNQFLSAIGSVLVSIGEARHAAYLARQGKVSEAKNIYRK